MTIGFVFKLDPAHSGCWGVLSYSPETTVRVRFIDTDSVYTACRLLGGMFAGAFIPADSDTAAWGRTIFRMRGSALLLN